jgi:hypothetical protein
MSPLVISRRFRRILPIALNNLSLAHELAGIPNNDLARILSFGYIMAYFSHQLNTNSSLMVTNFALV